MAKKTTHPRKFSDQLRRAIDGCGMSRYEIAKRTGISQPTLSRFMSGERGLTLAAIDTLATLLEWEVVVRGRKSSPTNKKG